MKKYIIIIFFFLGNNAYGQIDVGIYEPGTYGAYSDASGLEIVLESNSAQAAFPVAAEFNLILSAPEADFSGNEVFNVVEQHMNGGTIQWDPAQTFALSGKKYFVFNYSGIGMNLSMLPATTKMLAFTITISGGTGKTNFTIVDQNSDLFATYSIRSSLNRLGINLLNPTAMPATLDEVALPVEWLSFKAKPDPNGKVESILTWTTASELNSSHYEVEHSTNGTDFKNIGRVAAAGTTLELSDYEFIHKNSIVGGNYYQIKQVDEDGAFEYSEIRIVKFDGASDIQLFPNPTKGNLSLIVSDYTQVSTIELFNVEGKKIKSIELSALTENTIPIQLEDLSKGTYLLTITFKDESTRSEKIIKQ